MDYMAIATQVTGAAILAAVGWVIRSLGDLRERQAEAADAVDKRLDAVEVRMVQVEEIERHNVISRLGELERRQEASVTRDQLARIHERIDESRKDQAALGGDVAKVAGEVRAIHGTVQLIQQQLMRRGES